MLRDGDRHHTLKQDIVAEPSTHSVAAGLLQQNSTAGNLQGGGLDCPNWWEYIFFLMYISTKCTEIQASWYYMQHFHSSVLATAFNSFISIFFFRCILSNIDTIFTFCTSFTCTKSWQIFPTVTYFQTCSMRWNAQRHILSCTSIGRNLGDDGNSTALPTPCSRGGQRDGEVVCLALGFFFPSNWFLQSFFI